MCQAGPLCLSPRWARTSISSVAKQARGWQPLGGTHRAPAVLLAMGRALRGWSPCARITTPVAPSPPCECSPLPIPGPCSWGGTRPNLAVPAGLGCAAGLAACPRSRTPRTHGHGAAGTDACSRAPHEAVLVASGKRRAGGGGGGSEEGSPPGTCLPDAAPPCRQDPLGLRLDFLHPKAATLPESPRFGQHTPPPASPWPGAPRSFPSPMSHAPALHLQIFKAFRFFKSH